MLAHYIHAKPWGRVPSTRSVKACHYSHIATSLWTLDLVLIDSTFDYSRFLFLFHSQIYLHKLFLVNLQLINETENIDSPLCLFIWLWSYHNSGMRPSLRCLGRHLQLPRRHDFGQLLVQSSKVVPAVKSKGFSAKKEKRRWNSIRGFDKGSVECIRFERATISQLPLW